MDTLQAIEGIFAHLGPFKEVAMILAAGTFGTAGGILLILVLDLPIIRKGVFGFMYTLGTANSLLLVRWFGKYGKRIEDKLQGFLQDVIIAGYFAGLDKDDNLKEAMEREAA